MRELYLGPYKLGRRIAEGGMGEVYEGLDETLHRSVALKIVLPSLFNDPKAIHRFQREATTLARLNHPAIVTVYSFGRQGGAHYLAMELVEGEPLSKRMAPDLPLGLAVRWLEAIVAGIRAAHDAGILHRDIKPSNILIRADDSLKIADFGLAKPYRGENPPLTEAGIVLGTLDYLAPEVSRGEAATIQSDIYSIGIIGYELLAGRRAFPGDDPARKLREIREKELEPVRRINPSVPPALAAVVERMCQKDPRRRYGALGEVQDRLSRALGARRGSADFTWDVNARAFESALDRATEGQVPFVRAPRVAARDFTLELALTRVAREGFFRLLAAVVIFSFGLVLACHFFPFAASP